MYPSPTVKRINLPRHGASAGLGPSPPPQPCATASQQQLSLGLQTRHLLAAERQAVDDGDPLGAEQRKLLRAKLHRRKAAGAASLGATGGRRPSVAERVTERKGLLRDNRYGRPEVSQKKRRKAERIMIEKLSGMRNDSNYLIRNLKRN